MDNFISERNYKNTGLESQRRYPNEQLVQFLAAHYFSLPREARQETKILELGSGSGANLWMIAKEGFDTYGVDIAPSARALCEQMLANYGVTATLSTGSMKQLEFEDSYFDAIVDVMSVEHTDLAGHRQAYAEIFRTLKSGGRFFSWHLGTESTAFREGGGTKLDEYTVDNIPNREVPFPDTGLTCFITAPLMTSLLTAAGFTDITIERVTRTYKNRSQTTECFALSARKPSR